MNKGAPYMSEKSWVKLAMRVADGDFTHLHGLMETSRKLLSKIEEMSGSNHLKQLGQRNTKWLH